MFVYNRVGKVYLPSTRRATRAPLERLISFARVCAQKKQVLHLLFNTLYYLNFLQHVTAKEPGPI